MLTFEPCLPWRVGVQDYCGVGAEASQSLVIMTVSDLKFPWRLIPLVPKIGPWHVQVLSAQLTFSQFPNKCEVLGVAPVMCLWTRIPHFLRGMFMRLFQACPTASSSLLSCLSEGDIRKLWARTKMDQKHWIKASFSSVLCPCSESQGSVEEGQGHG